MKKIWRGLVRYFKGTDKLLLCLCLICSAYSVILMCGIHNSGMATIRAVQMQIITSVLGLVAAMIISSFDYRFLSRLWKLYYPICIGLVVLTYFFGEQRVESVDDKAWLPIPFLGINFQPSELLKIAFILTFALHLEKVGDDIKNLKNLLLLCLHGAVPVLLIHFQGDDGTAVIFLLIFLSMIFSAGIQWRYVAIAGAALVVAAPLAWLYLMSNDQKLRILALFIPDLDTNGILYQQYNAKIAIGSGGGFGEGLFIGEHVYVPEIHNDFIFSFVGQSLGFVGCISVIVLLFFICFRLLIFSRKSNDLLGAYICIGVFATIAFQSIVNIGMNLSILPVIGVTLPFFSYGGTSVTTLYMGIGLALSVYIHNKEHLFIDD
ncbi:MAG: FtsW/RodA/SpoVE family cell cycle protein [Oscillospiraceae bacterium]|nr:FtsW/RodA/SpoVE family cell cycle protein [Oscillospiraceae bacterium]